MTKQQYIDMLIQTNALIFNAAAQKPYEICAKKITQSKDLVNFAAQTAMQNFNNFFICPLTQADVEYAQALSAATGAPLQGQGETQNKNCLIVAVVANDSVILDQKIVEVGKDCKVQGIFTAVDVLEKGQTVKSVLLENSLKHSINTVSAINLGEVIKHLSSANSNTLTPEVKRSMGMHFMRFGAKNED